MCAADSVTRSVSEGFGHNMLPRLRFAFTIPHESGAVEVISMRCKYAFEWLLVIGLTGSALVAGETSEPPHPVENPRSPLMLALAGIGADSARNGPGGMDRERTARVTQESVQPPDSTV